MVRALAAVIVIAACGSGKRVPARDAAAVTGDAIAVTPSVDAGVDAVPPAIASGGIDLEAELARLEQRRRKAKQPVEAVPLAYIAEIEGGVVVGVDAVPASPVKWGEQILDLHPASASVLYAVGSLLTGEQAPGHGVVYRRSGRAWKMLYQARNRPLIDVVVDKANKIHVAGARGLVIRLDGSKWADVALPPDMVKVGVLWRDGDVVWAGGANKAGDGLAYSRSNGAWTGGKVADGDWILSLGGSGGGARWAGGGDVGGVYHRAADGIWTKDAAFAGEQIRSFVVRGDVVWTAGEKLRRRDADGTWHAVDTGLGEQHTTVLDGPDDSLVVATMGGVLIGDAAGTRWTLTPIPYVVGGIAIRGTRIYVAFTVER